MKEFLQELIENNVRIDLVDGDLSVKFSKNGINPELVEKIRNRKAELVAYLGTLKENEYQEIPLAEKKESYALSSAQYRLWVQCQFDEINQAYNIPTTYVFESGVNRDYIEKAFRILIEKHEILRTVFRKDSTEEVRQFVLSPEELKFQVSFDDLKGQDNTEEKIEAILAAERTDLFDLENGPLLRVKLIQIDEDTVVLNYVVHHIISDAWSMRVIINELFTYYAALSQGEEIAAPPMQLQYKDYSEWEKSIIEGEHLQKQKAYWQTQFEDEIPVLDLVDENPRPPFKTYNGDIISEVYSEEILNGMKGVTDDTGITLFMRLLTVLDVLLYKYTGQKDIVIGTSIAGREHPDLENQIGFYLNALALRTRFTDSESYLSILETVRQTTLGAFENQAYPIDQVVASLEKNRDMSRSPLFDVMMDMTESSNNSGEVRDEGVALKPYNDFQVSVGSKFDLTFHFADQGSGLRVMVEYNTDIFSGDFARKMLSHLEQLMLSIIEAPTKPIAELSYVRENEHKYLTEEVNQTEQELSQGETLVSLFEKQVETTPDEQALVCEGVTFTYAELNERANQFADFLEKNGSIDKGDLVGIKLERSEWVVVAILGTLKAGACYIPIDPNYPQERIDYILENSGSNFIVDEDEIQSFNLMRSRYKKVNKAVEISPEDRAYVIYTSGSTGKPKGVMVEHRNAVNYIEWARSTYLPDGKSQFGLFTSVAFDLTVTSIFTALLSGNSLEVLGSTLELDEILTSYFSPETALNIVKFTPSHIDALGALDIPKTNVHTAIVGGEELTMNQVRTLRKLNPDIRIFNEYGPTETTVGVVVEEIAESPEKIYIGTPIGNTKVYLLDTMLNPVGKGVQGELYVGGAQVSRGYLNNEALTNERFISSPFVDGERLYKTGDIAKWSANNKLIFQGRNDDQVKYKGYRIELGGIEGTILEHPLVNASAVIVRTDSNSNKELIAYFAASEELSQEHLKAELGEFLPDYMVPSKFIQLEKLPLTTHGKVDKDALSVIVDGNDKNVSEYVAPTTELEQELVAIWESVLGKERIGIKDSFFDLGGDSIKILRLVSELRKALNVDLPIGSVYALKNIEEIIAYLDQQGDALEKSNKQRGEQEVLINRKLYTLKASVLSSDKVENRENIEDAYPMSAIEIGMVYESMLSKGVYHDQMVHHRFFHDFSLERFEKALSLIVDKHQILRTTFNLSDFGREVQLVHKTIELPLKYESLEQLDDDQQDAHLLKFLKDELNNPFELSKPMWRLNIFKLTNDFYTIIFQCHHAIIDGWSDAAFNTELSNLYQQLAENPDYIPAPLASSYRDHVVEQEIDRKDERIADFWKQELQGYSKLNMFTEKKVDEAASVTISSKELDDLNSFASSLNTSVKVVSFSAYLLTLDALNFEDELLTGLVTNVRPTTEDGEQILGCFLNTIPIKIAPDKKQTFKEFVQAVDQKLLELKDYERYGLRDIAELHGANHTVGNAFFDMYFNFVDFHVYHEMEERQETAIFHEEAPLEDDRNESSKVLARGNTFMDFHVSLTGGTYSANVHLTRTLKSGVSSKRIASVFEKALHEILYANDASLESFDSTSEDESRTLLYDLNDSFVEYEKTTIQNLFSNQVRKTPDHTALKFEGNSYSFRELDELSNKLAHYLSENKGVQAGTLVGLKLERSEWIVISILAILKNGAAYVPIDPEYPQDRMEYIESHSGFGEYVNDNLIEEFKRVSDTCPADFKGVSGKPDDMIYTIYTSGSTGKPKGVMLKQQSVVNLMVALRERVPVTTSDVILSQTTISFDIFVTEVYYPLVTGMTMILANEEAQQSPLEMQKVVSEEGVTFLQMTPSRLALVLQENDEKMWAGIKNLILIGEVFPNALYRELSEVYSGQVLNAYGPTETCVYSTMRALRKGESVDIGTPLANTQIYVLGENLEVKPLGVSGEFCIAGDGLATGYLKDEEITAEKFVNNPFADEGKLYRTGDIGRWLPDGNLQFLGRKDDQIKLRGYRIEPGEIEFELQQQISVDEAVVVLQSTNSGTKKLAAYMVASTHTDPSELRASLSKTLPNYMIPESFVYLDQLPLTGNGKINRKALSEIFGHQQVITTEIVAPETTLEERILNQWKEALGLAEIGVEHDFFNSGGNSIKAIMASMHDTGRYPVNLIYQYRTVREYAVALKELGVSELVSSYNAPEETRKNLVLLPFAGATDAVYFALAESLKEHFNIYIVTYPWHYLNANTEFLEGNELKEKIASEMRSKINGSTVILGTSAGAQMGLALLDGFGQSSIEISGLILCASEYPTFDGNSENPWESYTDAQIEIGLDLSAEIDAQMRKQMIDNVRHDGRISWNLISENRSAERNYEYPVQVILGEKDSSVALTADKSAGWKSLFGDVETSVIAEAGHYFIHENVAETAEIIKAVMYKWEDQKELLVNE